MEIFWIMAGFMAFCLIVFIAVAVMFPEWVGIQGKLAKKIEAEQKTDPNA